MKQLGAVQTVYLKLIVNRDNQTFDFEVCRTADVNGHDMPLAVGETVLNDCLAALEASATLTHDGVTYRKPSGWYWVFDEVGKPLGCCADNGDGFMPLAYCSNPANANLN